MLYELRDLRSRAASAENPSARAGAGGTANYGRKGAPCISPLKQGQSHVLLETEGPGMVRHIWCTLPPDNVDHLRNVILRMYWDGQPQPSVEVPLGDFFGVSHGRQRPMQAELVAMQVGKGFNCWIPMPFRSHAHITITNEASSDVEMFFYQVDFTLGDPVDEHTGYLHAQFRRANPCPVGEDFTILDGVEGRGIYLGTVLGVRSLYEEAWWGEGEVKFYLDGDRDKPTICGTGTEDYMGSAWGLDEVTTPYQGAPLVDREHGLYSLYRFHAKDPIYFQQSLRVTVQQIGCGSRQKARAHYGSDLVVHPAVGVPPESDICYFERSDDYASVAYWYQELPTRPFPVLPDREKRIQNLAGGTSQG